MPRLARTAVLLVLAPAAVLLAADDSARPVHVVLVTGDHEYSSEETMPALARALESYGMKCTVLKSYPDENAETDIPGLEALEKADVAVFFLRWRRLPAEQVAHIEKYLEAGKPVVGLRTSTHAFNYPRGHALERWNAFGEFALGAPPGWGAHGHTHYGHNSRTDVSVIPEVAEHPILKGVDKSFSVRSWLYHVLPKYPPPEATRLLLGTPVKAERKDAVANPLAWTWKTKAGGRVFTTTLGHPEDFQVEAVQRLLVNAIHWAAGRPSPETWRGKLEIKAAYHGIRPSAEKRSPEKSAAKKAETKAGTSAE